MRGVSLPFWLLIWTMVMSACSSTAAVDALRREDYAAAKRHLATAAARDDAGALYDLAVIARDGRTGPADAAAAAPLFLRAAALGHVGAQVAIGEAYEHGRGVARNLDEAVGWYRRAALQGDAEGQFRFGRLLDRGLGALRQPAEARTWYGRAAAQGHPGAHRALLALDAPRVGRAERGTVVALSTLPGDILASLAQLDEAAREAKVRLNRLSGRPEVEVAAARAASVEAEAAVDARRERAWRSVPFTRSRPLLVRAPLELAMLDLHIEIRRALGPNHRTYVSGLVADPGCVGDIVADRLVFRYGIAATAAPPASGVPEHVDLLRHTNAQLVCLGVRQVFDLESAMYHGFAAVADRMERARLGEMIPAFAQLVAPIQVLVFDARKHRGERSLGWRWFYERGPQLEAAVGRSGWGPDGRVYVWDRLSATLLAVDPCAGAQRRSCVDPIAFLRSLGDHRAIGFGDCALSGMLAQGMVQLGGEPRYACPSRSCETTSARDGATPAAATRTSAGLEQRWPSFLRPGSGDADVAQPASFCLPAGGGFGFQGSFSATSECIDDLLKGTPNPWDTYLACTTDAVSPDASQVPFGQMPGVPMGNTCRFAQSHEMNAYRDKVWDEQAGHYREPQLGEIPRVLTAGTAPTLEELERKRRDEEARTKQAAPPPKKETEQQKEAEKKEAEKKEAEQKKKDEAEKDPPKRDGGAAGSCVDAADCDDSCTAVGAQVAQINHCTDDLLGAFTKALGRAPRQPTRGEPGRPPGRVSIWDPDGAPVDASQSAVCLIGDSAGAPSTQAPQCGLILCPETSLSAEAAPGTCRCGSAAISPERLVRSQCFAIRCADEQVQTDDCRCEAAGASPSDRPPGRSPVDLRGLPGDGASRRP